MNPTLKSSFAHLATLMPDLLRLRSGTLLPTEAPPALANLGLADEHGLTRKGQLAVTHLLALATLLDLPYA